MNMIECLVTLSRDGAALAIVGIIGGVVGGMFLMLYRDIAANERGKEIFWVDEGRHILLHDKFEKRPWFERQMGRNIGPSNEESFEELYNMKRIGSLKAATFSLGAIVLGSTLILIPFSGLGVAEATWIAVGLVAGACFEHAVWLFAQADFPRPERSLYEESQSALGEFLDRIHEAADSTVTSFARLAHWMASFFGRRRER